MTISPYFYTLRYKAREQTVSSVNRKVRHTKTRDHWGNLTIASIEERAVAFAEVEWPKFYGQYGHYGFSESWGKLYWRHQKRPDFFDMAIWWGGGEDKVLLALALGNPSHSRTHLTLKWVERYLGPNPLAGKVLLLVLDCALRYAALLGSERVLVKDPVDPTIYERHGFAPYRHPGVPYGGCYLAKEVDNA